MKYLKLDKVVNVYMAKAPSTAASFDGSGQVWFKVFNCNVLHALPVTHGHRLH